MAGERGGYIAALIGAGQKAGVLFRVFLFVSVGVGIFLAAYLGYFVLPFIFVLAALAILGLTGMARHFARLRRFLRR